MTASLLALATIAPRSLPAQNVAPLMAEYKEKAVGSFEVMNTSDAAATVVLEPKSFQLAPDGTAQFRPLDPEIHLQLSAQSIRLEAHQTGRIFYRVFAEHSPAWLCIYSGFLVPTRKAGTNLKIMVPHTVYIYQQSPLTKDSISVGRVWFDRSGRTVRAELTNQSALAGRAQAVEVSGAHSSASSKGFPMLPHSSHVMAIDWPEADPPQNVEVQFTDFSLKLPVDAGVSR